MTRPKYYLYQRSRSTITISDGDVLVAATNDDLIQKEINQTRVTTNKKEQKFVQI